MTMNALHIAVKDLDILFRNRGTAVQLLGLPLILVFSGALQAVAGRRHDTWMPLAVVDEDRRPLAQTLTDEIDASGGIIVVDRERVAAEDALDKGEPGRARSIPREFGADVATGRVTGLRLVVEGIARDTALESQILVSL